MIYGVFRRLNAAVDGGLRYHTCNESASKIIQWGGGIDDGRDQEDRRRVAQGIDPGTVSRAAREGDRASLHRGVRRRHDSGGVQVCGLRAGTVLVGLEIRLRLRLAELL